MVDEHTKCFREYVLPESLNSMDVIEATHAKASGGASECPGHPTPGLNLAEAAP